MISEQDITQLKEVFVTKEEFFPLVVKHDALDVKVDGIQETVGDLKVEMGEVHETVDEILVRIDNFVGSVRALEQENSFGARLFERHDRQLEALANSVGITLPN